MPTFVFRDGLLVDKSEAAPRVIADAAPNVISDIMEPTRHMATGKYHTSKSEFRKDTKASGCIEIGNDSSLYRPRPRVKLSSDNRKRDIKRAIDELKSGRRK